MRFFHTILVLTTMISCQAQNKKDQMPLNPFDDVSNEQAYELIKSKTDLQIVDVRQNAEVAEGIIKNAVQMDISKPAFYEQIETLDKTKPVLVYCAAGGRSKTAQEIMQEAGFTEVYNLKKGFEYWK